MTDKVREAAQQAQQALEEIAFAGMSPAPEMIDVKEAFHARQAWRFISIAANALEPLKEALAEPVQEPVAREQVLVKHIEFQKAETQKYFELYNRACETAQLRLKEIARLESRLAALAEPVQEPVAKVELMTTGGNAGLATRIVETDDHLRDRLRPGQLLYAAPPEQRKPLSDEEIDRLWGDPQQGYWDYRKFARAVEAYHGIKEKNT